MMHTALSLCHVLHASHPPIEPHLNEKRHVRSQKMPSPQQTSPLLLLGGGPQGGGGGGDMAYVDLRTTKPVENQLMRGAAAMQLQRIMHECR